MRALALALAFALALVPAWPTAAAAPEPSLDPTGLVLRADDDGNATLLLHVEDAPGGVVTRTPVTVAQTRPHVREVGAYTRAYEGFGGAPTVSAGVYVEGDGLSIRIPLVLVENAASTNDVAGDLSELVATGLATGNLAIPFAQEILLPELAANFGGSPDAARFATYRDHPTTYVWTAHRASPAGSVWAGEYLARTGSATLDGAGKVASARADAELGVATRLDAETTRAAAAYVETTYDGTSGAQAQRLVAGLVTAGLRTPLAAAELADWRAGTNLSGTPDGQTTRATVGVYASSAYVPLVGVETTQTARPSQTGTEITRITSVGAYTIDGVFTPVAGLRYHSDAGTLQAAVNALAGDGPGAPRAGNFEVDVGTLATGEYVPLAGVIHRDHFREMRYAHASLVGAGVYTPLGFAPIAVATYDGSLPLVDWANALVAGDADGLEWMVATGSMAAGSYLPLVGIGTVGRAPLQERAEGYEVRVGVFAGSYHAFVPLASLGYDGDDTPATHALAFATGGTLGSDAGAFDLRVGTYAAGEYVGLVGAAYSTPGENETMLVAGTYVGPAFVPLVGVRYVGDDDLVGSLNNPTNLRDDDEARLYAGVFVDGVWTPVLMVQNDGDGVRVLAMP